MKQLLKNFFVTYIITMMLALFGFAFYALWEGP